MSKEDKRKSRIITIIALAQMVAALVILVVGVLHKNMTNLQSNILMGGTLLIYWILMDIAEPILTHRLEGISQAQKDAYPKYVLFDFIGYAGIAYFLLGMGSSQSSSIIGAVIYAVSIKPKQENQKIFMGQETPQEDAEEAEPVDGELTDTELAEESQIPEPNESTEE